MGKRKLEDIHEEALRLFNDVQDIAYDERKQCLEDRRFYSINGAQWEGSLKDQFKNKPRLEFNKIHLAIIKIINDYRNNRFDLKFISKTGEKSDSLADTCASLYRACEQDSNAQEAYDAAFEEAIAGGFGAWRLRTEYEDEADEINDSQLIKIEPIFDADSTVFFDSNAKRQDKADADFCFVLNFISRRKYEELYDDNPSSWPSNISSSEFDWSTPDTVAVVEYYVVENHKSFSSVWSNGAGQEKRFSEAEINAGSEEITMLPQMGFREMRRKTIKKKRVHKYILSGGGVLEDVGYIAGTNIPIVPVFGKRWVVDGVERCMGHVRNAKDAQRLKNMQMSKLAEYSAISSVEKPIFTPAQVSGHQVMWAEDNIRQFPYLLINPIMDVNGNPTVLGPAAYTKPPQLPPALGALLGLAETDIKDILGNQQQGQELNANTSGKAVELVQSRIDAQSYIYISNFAKALKRSGEIWLGMAQEIFDEPGRKIKGIDSAGEAEAITVKQPTMENVAPNEDVHLKNDMSRAAFDVTVDIGPTSSSKREASLRNLTNMMMIAKDPETLTVLGAMAIMNMEGEGVSDARNYYRKKLVQMGVIEPTKEEQTQMQQSQQAPNPQGVYLAAAAKKQEADALVSVAKAKETEARTREIEAKIIESHSKSIETLAGIDSTTRQQIESEIVKPENSMAQPVENGTMPTMNQIPQEQQPEDGMMEIPESLDRKIRNGAGTESEPGPGIKSNIGIPKPRSGAGGVDITGGGEWGGLGE